ncbi:MAG TPA: hypothetical protein VGD94_20210 [Vicinamibacterales bacterium]
MRRDKHCGERLDSPGAQSAIYAKRLERMTPGQREAAVAALTPEQHAYIASAQPQVALTQKPSGDNFRAFMLGLILGPVGLWYKRQRGAGLAWLVGTFIVALTGVGLLMVPPLNGRTTVTG